MQYISKVVKMNELAVEIANLSGVPFKFVRTAEEVEQMQAQEAQSVAIMQEKQMADQVAMSNAIEKGKADAKKQGNI
jgi:protein-tyrosine-phosphatase